MTGLRIGSLASGYGGLDMGVQAVIGGHVVWHLEYDPAPSKILAHHWPDIPNHGDITTTDWTQVEPIDVLVGGYPCQPFSHAGKRRGTDDPRHIWPWIADAIRVLRPRLCVFENVAGHLGLGRLPGRVGAAPGALPEADRCLARAAATTPRPPSPAAPDAADGRGASTSTAAQPAACSLHRPQITR